MKGVQCVAFHCAGRHAARTGCHSSCLHTKPHTKVVLLERYRNCVMLLCLLLIPAMFQALSWTVDPWCMMGCGTVKEERVKEGLQGWKHSNLHE